MPVCSLQSAGLFNNVRHQSSLKRQLVNAIARDEFDLMYQPQMSMAASNIVGVEALLRWESTEFGAVSPVDFIPLAEKSGLISELGNMVIDKACEQAARWKQQYATDIRIAVNVSYMQLHTYSIVDFVSLCLDRYGLGEDALEIELTESSLIRDKNIVIDVLRKFREMGVRTAIDDFGTGYSSLSYLACMPFDMIKIDKSFIAMLGKHQANTRVTESIIQMGNNLGMEVLAEGVETEDQLSILHNNQCDLVQGNLICEPMNAASIPTLVGMNLC